MGLLAGIFGAIPYLVPLVTNVVHGVEALFGKGNGSVKKQAALATVQNLFSLYAQVQPLLPAGITPKTVSSEQFNQDLSNLIDAIVKLNNDLGIFQHN